MQKAKKMSKQTLVVAVLAILLVLSLALSVTGAWFTDSDTKSSEAELNFATVDVLLTTNDGVHYDASSPAQTVDRDLVPGDKVGLSGSFTNGDSSVAIYVAVIISDITLTGHYEDGEGEAQTVNLSSLVAGDGDTVGVTEGKYITVTPVTVTNGDAVEQEFTVTHGGVEHAVYKLTAADDVTYTFEGDVVFDTSLPNEVTIAGQAYLLNEGATGSADAITVTSVTVSASIRVFAIQADNIPAGEEATTIEGLL